VHVVELTFEKAGMILYLATYERKIKMLVKKWTGLSALRGWRVSIEGILIIVF
jgi:hypothetical protein